MTAAHRDSGVVLALYDPGVEVDMSRAPCRDPVGKRFYYGHDGLRTFYREGTTHGRSSSPMWRI
jgi:hypothetical protein